MQTHLTSTAKFIFCIIAYIRYFIFGHKKERLIQNGLAILPYEQAVNKYYLAKLFKRHTGFSPGEFLISLRMTAAKALLKDTDLTIAEIADAVGIEHVSHFINLFKRRVSTAPLRHDSNGKNLREEVFSHHSIRYCMRGRSPGLDPLFQQYDPWK
jgi:AraC-like DNA-binding protein